MKHVSMVLFAVAVFALSACKGGGDTLPDPAAGGVNGGLTTSGSDDGNNGVFTPVSGGGGVGGPSSDPRDLVVYFDYDQAEIRPQFTEMLASHGRWLSQNANAQVRLEGHSDERGSREYNIGLGERRSQAVRRVLLLQGATATQLSTVSYGEERPAATASDEESWGLNRRVELVYR